ncbi:hypothetical protein HH303_03585 [Rhodospirillaceae bacterium KN72]|uniref:Uncharacterized protein n=1 Tax=Pacificispira spongiicola TaxID=2729598 RepID=A0A7Y0DXT4_9PROT|nr:hypothetical protein [Pacificispira spongiicola]NMM43545.1 hypothetical protein [Pacificispira spongiicola]
MRHFRGLGGVAALARGLALFALLLQFTMPLAGAVAADLSGGGSVPSLSICFAGTSAPEKTIPHACAMPGGCCVLSWTAPNIRLEQAPVRHAAYMAFESRVERPVSASDVTNFARGPPRPSV